MSKPRSRKARARLRRAAQEALDTVWKLSGGNRYKARLFVDQLNRPLTCPECHGSGAATGRAGDVDSRGRVLNRTTTARCLMCDGRGKLQPRRALDPILIDDRRAALRATGALP